jgi:hypothetical protein
VSESAKTLFYPAWISTHAGQRPSLCWGPACDSLSAAQWLGKAEIAAGNASLAFVVECTPDHPALGVAVGGDGVTENFSVRRLFSRKITAVPR